MISHCDQIVALWNAYKILCSNFSANLNLTNRHFSGTFLCLERKFCQSWEREKQALKSFSNFEFANICWFDIDFIVYIDSILMTLSWHYIDFNLIYYWYQLKSAYYQYLIVKAISLCFMTNSKSTVAPLNVAYSFEKLKICSTSVNVLLKWLFLTQKNTKLWLLL